MLLEESAIPGGKVREFSGCIGGLQFDDIEAIRNAIRVESAGVRSVSNRLHWRLESAVFGLEKLPGRVGPARGMNRELVCGERRNEVARISNGTILVAEWMPGTAGRRMVSKYLIPLFTTTITGSQEISGSIVWN